MRQKPWILILWPILFVGIALSLPAQIMILYGHGFSEFTAVLDKLTFFNWLVVTGLLVNAYGLTQARPWVRYSLPLVIVAVAVNNFFVGVLGIDYSGWTALFSTVGFIALHVPLASKELLDLFANPAYAWWREAERKVMRVQVKIDGLHGLKLRGETFDISTSGTFVMLQGEDHRALKDNQEIQVCLVFNRVSEFRCMGRVVRRSLGDGKFPLGVGIQFVGLSWSERSDLQRKLERTSKPYVGLDAA